MYVYPGYGIYVPGVPVQAENLRIKVYVYSYVSICIYIIYFCIFYYCVCVHGFTIIYDLKLQFIFPNFSVYYFEYYSMSLFLIILNKI